MSSPLQAGRALRKAVGAAPGVRPSPGEASFGGGVKRRNAECKKLWNLSELVRSDFVPAQSQSPGSQSSSTKFKPAVTPP